MLTLWSTSKSEKKYVTRAILFLFTFSLLTNISFQHASAATVGTGRCTSTVGSSSYVQQVTISGSSDCLLKFTQGSTTWTPPVGVTNVRYLVVAGGAGGDRGVGGYFWGHGGGGGQVLDSTVTVSSSQNYSVVVGAGGTPGMGTASWVNSTTVTPTTTGAGNGGASTFASVTAAGGLAASIISPTGGSSGRGFAGGTSAGNMTTSGCVSNLCGAGFADSKNVYAISIESRDHAVS